MKYEPRPVFSFYINIACVAFNNKDIKWLVGSRLNPAFAASLDIEPNASLSERFLLTRSTCANEINHRFYNAE